MTDKLTRAQAIVSENADAIRDLFLPGVRVTVIVRRPGMPDQDFLMSDETFEDLEQVILLIARRQLAHFNRRGQP